MSPNFKAVLIVAAVATMFTGMVARADDNAWTRSDTTREVVWQAINAMDAWQTADIQNHSTVQESAWLTRRVIGDQPSTQDTVMYFATSAVIHLVISRALPKKWRPWFQGGTIAYSGALVINNCTEHSLGPC